METGVKVGDCMKTSLVTIKDSASVLEAACKMKQSSVGSILLTNDAGRIYGILTAEDIVHKAVTADKIGASVKEFASSPLLSVTPDADLSEAARKMGEKNVKRLVVKSDGKITGIISERDIIKLSPSLYTLIAERERLNR
jgi:CBS domain-containing protein